METRIITTPEDFVELAKVVIDECASITDRAAVILLRGDLGAGKTTFTQALARELAVPLPVTSPTFVIMHSYDAYHERWRTLVHVDAYRIEDPHEIEVLNVPELFEDPDTIIAIEWPEKISALLPQGAYTISLRVAPDETRIVAYGFDA